MTILLVAILHTDATTCTIEELLQKSHFGKVNNRLMLGGGALTYFSGPNLASTNIAILFKFIKYFARFLLNKIAIANAQEGYCIGLWLPSKVVLINIF